MLWEIWIVLVLIALVGFVWQGLKLLWEFFQVIKHFGLLLGKVLVLIIAYCEVAYLWLFRRNA